jgi:hypothetical protein
LDVAKGDFTFGVAKGDVGRLLDRSTGALERPRQHSTSTVSVAGDQGANEMRTAGRITPLLLLFALLLGPTAQAQVAPPAIARTPKIQIALLLDTSSSMDGLINQAKSQLWKMVNELADTRQEGLRPDVEVALYEYGKSSLTQSEGYIRQILALGTDLDKLSEELFALTTNGGEEYCGQVITRAIDELTWSPNQDDLKVIIIAGNEPFDQGPVNWRKAVKGAIAKGVMVDTIHCGTYEEGVRGHWRDGALLADGAYMHIDQNQAVVHIAAPQDAEIARLGAELNDTYIPLGPSGAVAAERQMAQDSNAKKASAGSMVQRAVFKSKANYSNTGWDLVDAVSNGKVKLEEVEEEKLPEAVRKMDKAERKVFVEQKKTDRARIQGKIRELNEARKKFVTDKRKEMSKKGADSFDEAMLKAVRKQAKKKNFKIKK